MLPTRIRCKCMKKVILLVVFGLLCVHIYAQDIIVKKDGRVIKAKVLELTETDILYKNYTKLDGRTYSTRIENVLSLTYENGQKESFGNAATNNDEQTAQVPSSNDVSEAIQESRVADLEANHTWKDKYENMTFVDSLSAILAELDGRNYLTRIENDLPLTYKYGQKKSFGNAAINNDEQTAQVPSSNDVSEAIQESRVADLEANHTWKDKYENTTFVDSLSVFLVKNKGKFGICSIDGKELIPCVYDAIYAPRQGSWRVRNDWKYGLYAADGRLIIPCEYDNIYNPDKQGSRIVKKDGKRGLYSAEGKLIMPCEYDYISNPDEQGLYKVEKDRKHGLYSAEGRLIIPCEYDLICLPDNGLYKVNKDGKLGLYSSEGKVLVPCEYESVLVKVGNEVKVKAGDGKWHSYDIEKHVIVLSNSELYSKYFDEGHLLFKSKKWKKAEVKYKLAAKYKQTFAVNYNIAVCLYNRNKYKEARKYFQASLRYNHGNEDESAANRLIAKCDQAIQERNEAFAEFGMAVIGVAAGVAAAALAGTPAATPSVGYTPSSSYHTGDGPDAAIANANRIMQQSEARMQYDMANAPRLLMQQTQQRMAAEEAAKEAQWRQMYEQYKLNPGYMLNEDGSILTWEQFKDRMRQIEAQAYMEMQREGNGGGGESSNTQGSERKQYFHTETTENECAHCSVPGNGKCATCGGDGWMDSGFGLGVNTQKCSSCYNQDGNCTWCHGTGKISKTKVVTN